MCFCITWGNRKAKNCVFSHKCCTLFTKNNTKHIKIHLVTAEPPFTVKTIDRMHQTGPKILLSVTHTFYVNQKCHGVSHHHQRERKKQIENLLEFLRRREMTAIVNHSVKHFWLQIIKEFLRHIFSSTMYVTTNFSIQLFNCIFSYSNFNYNCTYYVVCMALCMYYL